MKWSIWIGNYFLSAPAWMQCMNLHEDLDLDNLIPSWVSLRLADISVLGRGRMYKTKENQSRPQCSSLLQAASSGHCSVGTVGSQAISKVASSKKLIHVQKNQIAFLVLPSGCVTSEQVTLHSELQFPWLFREGLFFPPCSLHNVALSYKRQVVQALSSWSSPNSPFQELSQTHQNSYLCPHVLSTCLCTLVFLCS